MDICEYVVEYGTGSTSMLLREMANRAEISPESYEVIDEIATKLENVFTTMRKEGGCSCQFK